MDGAIADYSQAIQHADREDPALYGIRSALYLGKREFEKALDDTNRLLELHPQAEVGYANRATARMYLGDVKGAIDDCNRGLALDNSASGAALLYNNRGTAHRLDNQFTAAMSDYNLAMSTKLNPRQKKMVHPTILSNQGIIYYLKEEFDQARAYFQQAVGMNPDFLKGRAGLAVARYKLGQEDEARKIWRELVAKKRQYRNSSWLQRELNWPMSMMADAADLIETL
jgi:tetratricopeptide (TPR) repeat protein